jgi:hypothetical protein
MNAHPTSFQRIWSLGYKSLLPVVPADGGIRNAGKRPGLRNDLGWYGVAARDCVATEPLIGQWGAMGAGVGLRCDGQFIAIDIDTLAAEWAAQIRDMALQSLGPAPRRIGRAPKELLLYRVNEDIGYRQIRFTDGTQQSDGRPGSGLVELLSGAGGSKWFVMHGIHPDTRRPYTWPDGLPAADELTVVTLEQLDAFFALLEAELPVVSRSGSVSVDRAAVEQDKLRGDPDLVRSALLATPNDTGRIGYDEWVKTAAALRGALPDDYALGLDLFEEWTESAALPHATERADRVFGSISPPFGLGADYVYSQAERMGGWSGRGLVVAREWFDAEAAVPQALLFPESAPSLFGSEGEGAGSAEPAVPLRAGKVEIGDLIGLPPRQWLLGFKVSRRYVTFVASPGGTGKTAWVFASALAAASGRALLHDRPVKPLRVWIYNLEDDLVELRRRLAAALRLHELDPSVLDNIRLNSGRDRRFRIVRQGKDGGFIVLPDYRAIIEEMKREAIDVLVVDPYLRSHGVSENENEAQDEVMRLYAQIAEETNAGVVLVHHTKKGAIAGDMDSLRGGSTQGGGARAAFTLTTMSAEEAGRFGVAEDARRQHVRIDDAKNNMAPAGRTEWLRLASWNLENASEDYPGGDSVQVATKWTPPDAWEGLEAGSQEGALEAIGEGLENGERYSVRPQDVDRWVGTMLMQDYGRTPSQAKYMVDQWLQSGVLGVQEYHSPSQRKTRKGLFVLKSASETSVYTGGLFD